MLLRKPEPDSLRHILVTNTSTRLYQPPDLWNLQTLQLLDCHYAPPDDLTNITSTATSEATAITRHGPLRSGRHRRNAQLLLPPLKKYAQVNVCLEKLGESKLRHFRDVWIRNLFSRILGFLHEGQSPALTFAR